MADEQEAPEVQPEAQQARPAGSVFVTVHVVTRTVLEVREVEAATALDAVLADKHKVAKTVKLCEEEHVVSDQMQKVAMTDAKLKQIIEGQKAKYRKPAVPTATRQNTIGTAAPAKGPY